MMLSACKIFSILLLVSSLSEAEAVANYRKKRRSHRGLGIGNFQGRSEYAPSKAGSKSGSGKSKQGGKGGSYYTPSTTKSPTAAPIASTVSGRVPVFEKRPTPVVDETFPGLEDGELPEPVIPERPVPVPKKRPAPAPKAPAPKGRPVPAPVEKPSFWFPDDPASKPSIDNEDTEGRLDDSNGNGIFVGDGETVINVDTNGNGKPSDQEGTTDDNDGPSEQFQNIFGGNNANSGTVISIGNGPGSNGQGPNGGRPSTETGSTGTGNGNTDNSDNNKGSENTGASGGIGNNGAGSSGTGNGNGVDSNGTNNGNGNIGAPGGIGSNDSGNSGTGNGNVADNDGTNNGNGDIGAPGGIGNNDSGNSGTGNGNVADNDGTNNGSGNNGALGSIGNNGTGSSSTGNGNGAENNGAENDGTNNGSGNNGATGSIGNNDAGSSGTGNGNDTNNGESTEGSPVSGGTNNGFEDDDSADVDLEDDDDYIGDPSTAVLCPNASPDKELLVNWVYAVEFRSDMTAEERTEAVTIMELQLVSEILECGQDISVLPGKRSLRQRNLVQDYGIVGLNYMPLDTKNEDVVCFSNSTNGGACQTYSGKMEMYLQEDVDAQVATNKLLYSIRATMETSEFPIVDGIIRVWYLEPELNDISEISGGTDIVDPQPPVDDSFSTGTMIAFAALGVFVFAALILGAFRMRRGEPDGISTLEPGSTLTGSIMTGGNDSYGQKQPPSFNQMLPNSYRLDEAGGMTAIPEGDSDCDSSKYQCSVIVSDGGYTSDGDSRVDDGMYQSPFNPMEEADFDTDRDLLFENAQNFEDVSSMSKVEFSNHRKANLVTGADVSLGVRHSTVDVHQCNSSSCKICNYKPKDIEFIHNSPSPMVSTGQFFNEEDES